MRVTIQDCRDAGYCVRGVRARCDALGLDFRALCRDGIPVEDVNHIDDADVQKIIEQTERREHGR